MPAQFCAEDGEILMAAAEATIATSRARLASGENAAWRPGDDYDPQTTMDVVKSRYVLSVSSNDGLVFAHLQCFLNIPEGKSGVGPAKGYFRRRIMGQPDAFPPEFWQLSLQRNLTALGTKCRPICIGLTI